MGEQGTTLFIVEQVLNIPNPKLLERQFWETLGVREGRAAKLTRESVLQNAQKGLQRDLTARWHIFPRPSTFLGN